MRFGVAMIASVFHPSVGGIQTHTLQLTAKLRARGVDAFVLTRAQPSLALYEEIRGVPTYRLGSPQRRGGLGSLNYILECGRFLARHRQRWQVVHAQQMLSPMTIGLLARSLPGKKLVVTAHASGPELGDVWLLRHRRPLGRARLSASLKFVDAFVSISARIREDLRTAGARDERVWELPQGVDTERFRPLRSQDRAALRRSLGLPSGWLVVFSGRLAPEKGLDVLLQAWPSVVARKPGAQLLLLGAGELLDPLFALAESLGVASSVHFAGQCQDAAPILQAADAFVLPSHTEGMPMSLLEAMSCGLPVVASAVGGMCELVTDGVNGALVPPGNCEALAEKLLAASEPSCAQPWGQRARRMVLTHHSLDTVIDSYLELYQHLLGIRDRALTACVHRPAA